MKNKIPLSSRRAGKGFKAEDERVNTQGGIEATEERVTADHKKPRIHRWYTPGEEVPLHNAAQHHFQRSDWFNDRQIIQFPNDVRSLGQAREALRRRRKPLEPGRIQRVIQAITHGS